MARTYDSPVRAAQTQATRQRIVDALLEQASEVGREDFSIADVAARAGVAERTVFRHFPTRESLLEAVAEHLDDASRSHTPRSPEDFPRALGELFGWFEAHPHYVEASHTAGIGRLLRARGRVVRAERAKRQLDEWLADLPEAERRRAFGVLRSMFGSFVWRTMRKELGMSAKDTLAAAQWVAELLLADLQRRRAEARKNKNKNEGKNEKKEGKR